MGPSSGFRSPQPTARSSNPSEFTAAVFTAAASTTAFAAAAATAAVAVLTVSTQRPRQVGATVGVGSLEGRGGVNWRLMLGVGAAWVFTIVITASLTAGLYAFVVYSPSLPRYEGTRPDHPQLVAELR